MKLSLRVLVRSVSWFSIQQVVSQRLWMYLITFYRRTVVGCNQWVVFWTAENFTFWNIVGRVVLILSGYWILRFFRNKWLLFLSHHIRFVGIVVSYN